MRRGSIAVRQPHRFIEDQSRRKMPYDENLANRVRRLLARCSDIEERAMFGGLAFLVRGHMAVGIVKDELMVRVGPDSYAGALKEPHARAMDFTGRPMKGLVFVSPEGLESDAALERWIDRGFEYAASLPAKKLHAKAERS